MSVFDRLETLLRSEWNARRPRSSDDRLHPADLEDARAAMRRLMADEQLLDKRIQQSRSEIRYRQSEAERAVRDNDESAARAALREKIQEEKRLESMERDWKELRRRIDQIQETLASAEEQVSGFQPARAQRSERPPASSTGASYYRSLSQNTEAQPERGERRRYRSGQQAGGYSADAGSSRFRADYPQGTASSDPFDRFDDMADRMEGQSARIEAERSLGSPDYDSSPPDDDPLADPLESKFEELESRTGLEDLKRRAKDGGGSDSGEEDPLSRLKNRLSEDDE
jgi:phage shock protein A